MSNPDLPPDTRPGRRHSRRIAVGKVDVGGGSPVSVQSMTNTDTHDTEATLRQIRELSDAGCDIVRVAVPDRRAVPAFGAVADASPIPVVADVHFDYRLAVAAIEAGADCVRINPGNIGGTKCLQTVVLAAAAAGKPLRIGVNGGSLEADLEEKHGGATPAALAESAVRHCRHLEDLGFGLIKVSIKSSSVTATVTACRRFARETDYPLHLGVTEAGPPPAGVIKSAAALGAMLLDGIGDTIRVSLTANPVEEVIAGIRILQAVGLRPAEPEIVSCPTCGRTAIDLLPMVEKVQRFVEKLNRQGLRVPLAKVAIMGCAVNGPGEARDADLGIAGGRGRGALFKHGQVVARLPEEELLQALLDEIRRHAVPRKADT